MTWIHVAQDADHWRTLVNTVMNLQIPYSNGNVLSGWASDGFSRSELHAVTYLYSKYNGTNIDKGEQTLGEHVDKSSVLTFALSK